MLENELCHYLEGPHPSVTQSFLDDQFMMLQNHMWVNEPLRAQSKTLEFSVTEQEKGFEVASESTLQITFEKVPLVEFWCSIKKY